MFKETTESPSLENRNVTGELLISAHERVIPFFIKKKLEKGKAAYIEWFMRWLIVIGNDLVMVLDVFIFFNFPSNSVAKIRNTGL